MHAVDFGMHSQLLCSGQVLWNLQLSSTRPSRGLKMRPVIRKIERIQMEQCADLQPFSERSADLIIIIASSAFLLM